MTERKPTMIPVPIELVAKLIAAYDADKRENDKVSRDEALEAFIEWVRPPIQHWYES